MRTAIEIPGYDIIQVLYEGVETIIYRAINRKNKNPVIIKSLRGETTNPLLAFRLSKEYKTLEEISIAGVTKVHELVTTNNQPLLVMEDFGGVTLSAFFRKRKFDLQEFLNIAIRLADTLGQLHQNKIIHRNISPDAVLVNPTTCEIRLIDFETSTRISNGPVSPHNPAMLQGMITYMSPEQTGRMNRTVDHRTDLYSLGIVFYQMLTGTLPFDTDDPLELIHCHMAKKIVPASVRKPGIPPVLSDIVAKLTAKIADERYQTAFGLKEDLEHCLRSYVSTGSLTFFTIGVQDVMTSFKVPETLYGREEEVAQLLQALATVTTGKSVFLQVNGLPGIGKTSLVQEIHKPVTQSKGYFIAGKFDQYNTTVPFHAFRQAFAELLQYQMRESREKLHVLKEDLLQKLGANISILTALIPEYELLLGKQKAAVELMPTEAKNRFFFTLRDFVKIIATPEHPLVIFLDDLQWSDDASLHMMRELMARPIPYLLLIASCRTNEISDGHPAFLALDDIRKTGLLQEINVNPLEKEAVSRFVSQAMLASAETIQPLTDFLFRRTAGNPFFICEILKAIYREGLMHFTYPAGPWVCAVGDVAKLNISDSVVQFMTERLKELPEATQKILEWASCLGTRFSLVLLKKILGKEASELSDLLWPAVEKELVVPLSDDYPLVEVDFDLDVLFTFLHDRIRQASYALLSEQEQREHHLAIGRTLLQTTSPKKPEELAEIVRHYNRGWKLLTDPLEKVRLAEMNLALGKRTQAAVAYHSALHYFENGIALIGQDGWNKHYRLLFELYKGLAQNAYQTNDVKAAEESIELLLQHAKTNLEKVEVLSLRIRQYNTVGKAEEAIRSGVEGLALLGFSLPENPGPIPVFREITLAKWNLGRQKVQALATAPVVTDPVIKAAARLLTEIAPAAFILGRDNLFGLTQLKIVNLSLKHGNCPESSYAYITFGVLLKEAFGDLQAAENFGQLGLQINEQLEDIEYRCRVIAAYGVLTHHFSHHWNTSSDWFQKGVEAGRLSGDLFYLAHCAANCTVWNPALDIATSLAEQQKYLAVVKDTNYEDAIDTVLINLQATKNVLGRTYDSHTLNDDTFTEEDCLKRMVERKYTSGIGIYYIRRAEILLFYEAYEKAWEAIKEADRYGKSLLSLAYLTRLCVVAFFVCAGSLATGKGLAVRAKKKRMRKEFSRMKKWAGFNPNNFFHWQKLMEAELYEESMPFQKTSAAYEAAISLARQNGWPLDEAFANNLAAKFYTRLGNKAAIPYWTDCYKLYQKAGATGKTEFLKQMYGDYIGDAMKLTSQPADSNLGKGMDNVNLDLATILRSSQAISEEIGLKSLLCKMMQIIVMNAGAERGVLLLEEDGALYIEAATDGNEVVSMQHLAVPDAEMLPQSIVNFVSNAREAVVIDNAAVEGEFKTDEYISLYRPKSVLCSPLLLMNRLYGIIYLENNLSVGAFTEERLNVLNLLSSQMAISIQNAKLYANLEQKVEQRTQELRLEKKKTDDLLMNILPAEVAEELKQSGTAKARLFSQTTVMFTDFVDFTKISETLTATELVGEVNRYFTAFDRIVEQFGLEKIKTIGDAYLAVAGLPIESSDHALRAAQAAQAIVAFVEKEKNKGGLFGIRIGLHSGPVVAGVVGLKKFVYDIWGDTVNTAARMETTSEPGKINISKTTHDLLSNIYACEYRGRLNAKNKGLVEMYFLTSRKDQPVE